MAGPLPHGAGPRRPTRASRLSPGDLAPWFHAPVIAGNPNYAFNTVAGRHVLMLFFGSADRDATRDALQLVERHRHLFDDQRACFFGVTIDPDDESGGGLSQSLPGVRYFIDRDRAVSTAFGAMRSNPDGEGAYDAHWLLLDATLSVIMSLDLREGAQAMRALADVREEDRSSSWAPVLLVPRVFEPPLCRQLIEGFVAAGGEESGFMRDVDGKTRLLLDPTHKLRSDWTITDEALRRTLMDRVRRRLLPAVQHAFQFSATRMERYMVACYDGATGGHFRAHRDNTTKGTAHRRFAVTLNLNADDYDGGDLRFPEYGTRIYRPASGSAVVFSCSLLHEATPVTQGRRFAFLPFLYDEAAARERAANNRFLSGEVRAY